MLSPRTEKDYRQVVERWTRDGQPNPAAWVSERSSEAEEELAAALIADPSSVAVRWSPHAGEVSVETQLTLVDGTALSSP